jgi:hypothetical protein
MDKAIEAAIKKVIMDRLSESVIDSIMMEPGVDSDGDPVINVTVVLKNNASVDVRKSLGLVRHIRSGLQSIEAFPILSFLSKREAGKRLTVAAA